MSGFSDPCLRAEGSLPRNTIHSAVAIQLRPNDALRGFTFCPDATYSEKVHNARPMTLMHVVPTASVDSRRSSSTVSIRAAFKGLVSPEREKDLRSSSQFTSRALIFFLSRLLSFSPVSTCIISIFFLFISPSYLPVFFLLVTSH